MEKFPGGLNINTNCKTIVKFKNVSCQNLYQDDVYFYGVPTANRFLKINQTVSGTTTINAVTNPSDYYTINVNITQNSQSIIIPTQGNISSIKWGDGSTTGPGINSHIYIVPGIYSIIANGTPIFFFGNPLFSNIISIPSIGKLITYVSNMFFSSPITSLPGLSTWNTIKVTNMSGMFNVASSFNQPIGNWNTIKVTNMSGMFNGASSFNQPLNFNISNVTVMTSMFTGSGLDSSNASTFLINCAIQIPNIKYPVTLGISSSVFTYTTNTPPLTTAGLAAATTLTSAPYLWTIT